MDLIAKMGNTRIGYIDIAKCIAIVSVVVCHVLLMDLYSFHDVWDSPLMNFVSLYQMPLFMFLSGLVSITSKPQIGICRDLAKRFRQLFVPFVVFASLFSLWKEHSLGFVFDMFKWGYWYLWVLFIYYIFSYVLIRGQNVVAKYLLLLVVWFVATRYVDKMSQSVNDILSISLIVKYFPYFIVGNFVKRYNLHRILFDNSLLLYIAILVWACKSFFMFHYGEYIVSSAAIIVIMNVCKRIDDTQLSRKRIMTYIGENTLYIYIFHYFALEFMKTEYFAPFLAEYSCFYIDLLFVILPALGAISFSLGIKWLLDKDKMVMTYVFGKNKK